MTEKKKFNFNIKQNTVLRTIVIAIALFFDFGLRFLPAPSGMSQDAFGVIGVFVGSILLWMTISIDWPSVFCIFALALLPNFGFATAFTSSFGSETFVFLMFTFACTYALSKTAIIKRIAVWFISNKLAKKSGWAFVIMFLLSVTLVGMFMSPTVLFVILIPILEQIFELAGIQKGEKVGKLLYVGLAFCVSISSGMTPIAHVFPVLALKTAGLTIDYFKYMAFAVPVGLICIALMLLAFRIFLKPDVSKLKGVDVSEIKNSLPKIDAREICIVSIFAMVVFLWIAPSICMKNIILTSILTGLMIGYLLFNSISKIVKGKHENNKTSFVFGIVLLCLIICALLASLVLAVTNVYNIYWQLDQTNISFLILLGILFLIICTYALIKAIQNKKLIWLYSILVALLVTVCTLMILFNAKTLSVMQFISNLKTAMPPILGTVLLCMIQIKKEPLLNIQDTFKNGIPWSSLLMCAGTLTLGAAMTNNAIGLKTFLETNLTTALGGTSQIILLIVFVIWALIQTNLSSNMVTATLVSTVANTLLLSISTTLSIPAVISIIGMLSAYAFATPPSMPHIAITASSGYANTKDTFVYGLILMLISAIISLVVAYPLASLILK